MAGSRAHGPIGRRLLLGLVVAGFVLGALELGARLVPPPTQQGDPALLRDGGGGTIADPAYGWRPRPGLKVVDPVRVDWERRWDLPKTTGDPQDVVSSLGFRSPEATLPRPPDELRILSLGDSSVWGTGVPRDQTFTARLAAQLGEDVVGFNGGVPGWSSYQSMVQLRDSLHLGLDLVVVYSVNSDLMLVRDRVPDYRYFPAYQSVGGGFVSSLGTVSWLRHLMEGRVELRPPESKERRVPVAWYMSNLRELVAMAKEHDFLLSFVVAPVQDDLEGGRDLDYAVVDPASLAVRGAAVIAAEQRPSSETNRVHYRSAMAVVAHQEGVPLVDAPADFRAAVAAEPTRYVGGQALFVDDLHPGPNGHALIAQGLVQAVGPLIDARRTQRRAGRVKAAPAAPPLRSTAGSLSEPPERGSEDGQAGRLLAPGAEPPVGSGEAEGRVLELSCAGRPPPGTVALSGTVEGAPEDARIAVILAQRQGDRTVELANAQCGLAVSVGVPADLGPVRLIAFVDADGDWYGPTDRAAVSDILDPADGPRDDLRWVLGPAIELGPEAPPLDQPWVLHTVAGHLAQGIRAHPEDPPCVGLIYATDAQAVHPSQGISDALERLLQAQGLEGGAADVLDRPGMELAGYDAWLVVDGADGGLVAALRDHVGVDGLEEDQVLSGPPWIWTLVQRSQPRADCAERMEGIELLPAGRGRERAAQSGRPALPAGLLEASGSPH